MLENIKKVLRYFYYKNERRRIRIEKSVRKMQNLKFIEDVNDNIENLIIFLVDGADWHTGIDKISGGIMSVASIYEETVKLKFIHDSEVIMITFPNAYLLLKHTQFPNNINVYRFEQLSAFEAIKNLIVHVPEFKFDKDLIDVVQKRFPYLSSNNIHFNILNQRLDLMPDPKIINSVKKLGYIITQTTAHQQYSTQNIRDKFAIPLHKLSVYAKPSRYNFKPLAQREDLILVSPDKNENKLEILSNIKDKLPNYKIEIIKNITYSEYLEKIERSKFMITFGEGLDFYFIETVFSGGISFATYNTVFFTEIFKGLPGVFESYKDMSENVVDLILRLENKTTFVELNAKQFKAVNTIYNDTDYQENIKSFYLKNYTYS